MSDIQPQLQDAKRPEGFPPFSCIDCGHAVVHHTWKGTNPPRTDCKINDCACIEFRLTGARKRKQHA